MAHWQYQSIPIPPKPTLFSNDVTVIIAIIEIKAEELEQTTQSILARKPTKHSRRLHPHRQGKIVAGKCGVMVNVQGLAVDAYWGAMTVVCGVAPWPR